MSHASLTSESLRVLNRLCERFPQAHTPRELLPLVNNDRRRLLDVLAVLESRWMIRFTPPARVIARARGVELVKQSHYRRQLRDQALNDDALRASDVS